MDFAALDGLCSQQLCHAVGGTFLRQGLLGEHRAGSAPWEEADSTCVWLLTHEQEAGCQLALPLSSRVQLLEAFHDVAIAHKPIPHGAPLACAPVKGLGFF